MDDVREKLAQLIRIQGKEPDMALLSGLSDAFWLVSNPTFTIEEIREQAIHWHGTHRGLESSYSSCRLCGGTWIDCESCEQHSEKCLARPDRHLDIETGCKTTKPREVEVDDDGTRVVSDDHRNMLQHSNVGRPAP